MTQDFDWSSVGTPVESGSDDWSSVASPVSETPKQNKGIAGDTITDLKRGVQGIPGIATGLADMQTAWLTGDTYANKAADYLGEITGFQPSKWANEAKKEYSPARQASSLAVSKAWDDNDSPFNDAMNGDFSGIGNIAKSYVQNPLHTIGSVVESLPSMALGGLAGRGVGIATKISPALSGALGEGMVMAGQQMNQLTEAGADPRLSAASSLATGLFGAGVGAVGGKLSHHIGVVDPDTAMAGGAIRGVTKDGVDKSIGGSIKEVAKRVAGGAVSEGLFEELPQSVLEQTLSNLAQGKPWDEGVSRAAVEGTLAGSLMGGAFNVLPPSVQAPVQQPQDNQNQNPLLALPAPTYTGTPGDQITAADVDRQSAIDKAQAESDAIWAARDEYERQQNGYKTRPAPTITTDPEPIQQRIDALLGISQQRLSGIARSNYEKALEAAFNEQIGFVSGKNSEEIPFTMGDYLKSKVAAADITRDKPKADAANQNALNRLGQLDSEETQQIPEIPVVGPLSFAANNAVRTGASELIRWKQSVANSGQVAVETNQISSAAGVVAPNIASAAPSITDQAPSIEGGSNASKHKQVAQETTQANDAQARSGSVSAPASNQVKAIDLSNRTDQQLAFLTQHGRNGHKEAAIAELQKRGVAVIAPQQAKSDTLSNAESTKADVAPAKSPSAQQPTKESKHGQAETEVLNKPGAASFSAPESKMESRGLSVGVMPNNAEAITVKDGVVHIGKYPAQNFDTGEDITVPAGATDKQVVTALKDAGAIAGKMRVFGMEKVEVKDAIGWTAMTTVEREGLLRRAGYGGANLRLNLAGTRIARTAWDAMSPAVRDKLTAAYENQFKPADQNQIKNENPSAAKVQEEQKAPEQDPIKNIDAAANEASTSAKNDTTQPTEAQQKTDAAQESKQDKAPAITPQHVENGQAEPATAAVVEKSLKKGAANSPLDLRQERDLLLKKIDAAIAAAPTAAEKGAWDNVNQKIDLKNNMHVEDTIGYRGFDVPGDGKFKVLNLKEALQRFRSRVEANPGFKKPVNTTGLQKVAPWQRTTSGGSESTITDLLESGDYSAAVEFAKQIGKPLVFGQYQDGSAITVYTDAKPFEREGYDDFNMVSVRNPQGGNKVAWAVVDLNSGLTISSMHPTRLKAISETNKALEKTTPAQLATAVRSVKANTPGLVGTQEELEQRWLVNVDQREAEMQSKAEAENSRKAKDPGSYRTNTPYKQAEEVKPAATEPKPTEAKVNYKGFERVDTGSGKFELRDGNMVVKVEQTTKGKYQASFRSAKSSPHLIGEQGAVDWAASYRNDAIAMETDEQRYERIKATPVMQRDDKDVKWANEYKGRQQKAESEAEAKKADEQKAAIKADSINGFLDGKAPMQAGAIRNALNKQWRFDGVVMTARERIESLWRDGKLKVETYEENKIKPMSRRDFNRASQREQDAHEKKMREAGTKTVYVVSESELGKIAYDYAQHLLAKNADGKATKYADQANEVSIELGGGQISAKLDKPLIETTKESLIDQIKQQKLDGWKEGNLRLFTAKHGEAIKAAMDDGQAVPDEVLADYPGLIRDDLNDDQRDQMSDDLSGIEGAARTRAIRAWAPKENPASDKLTGNRRDPLKVNIFNPYEDGDIVTINGKDWQIRNDGGWYLTSTGNWRGEHPTIKKVAAMNDLIAMIEKEFVASGSANSADGNTEAKPSPRERGVADFAAGRERIVPDDLRNDRAIEYNSGYADAKNEADYLKSREGKEIVVLPSEFPLGEVDASYSHISHSGAGRARSDRDAFVEAVNGLYDEAMAKAETDEQKAAAKQAAISFKDEYLRRLQSVIRVRGQTYSGFVAGRAKLNSKQANSRNDALSRALDSFAAWQRSAEPQIMQAVRDARNEEQRAAERKAKEEKAARKKADLHALLGKLMAFKNGDAVKFGNYPVAKVSLDRAGYPSSVTVEAADLTDNKFDIARIMFNGDKDALRSAVDEIRAANPVSDSTDIVEVKDKYGRVHRVRKSDLDGSSDRIPTVRKNGDIVVGEEIPRNIIKAEDQNEKTSESGPESLVDQHNAAIAKLYDGDLSVDELKAAFALVRDNRSAIEAELSKFKKDELLRSGGPMFGYRYKSETKPEIVKAAYAAMLDNFIMGESISYALGGGTDWVTTKAKAIQARVDAATPESLAAYAEKIKANRAEREQRREETAKAMADPKTLEDYRRLLQAKVDSGKTSDQARMELTPEQRIAMDTLWAEDNRSRRAQRSDAAKTEVRVAAKTTSGDIIETKHTKTGQDLFVVKAAERVERDIYNTWNAAAKKLGGWYSSFRGNGAVPGFQFKTRDDANAFLQYLGGDATAAQEAVQEKRDAFVDDRSQSAVERLNEMADRLEEKADESLGRERKANTERRARFAASAEAAANSDKALAKTMRNIAKAIESGAAKFLDRVRQKSQVEMLRSAIRDAQYKELTAKYPSYADQERHKGEAPTLETVDYAKWPSFTAYRSDLAVLGREMSQIDGTKKIGQALLKVADDVTEAYQKFAKENLHKVSVFSARREGSDEKHPAVFSTAEKAESVIAKSGYKGKATTISFKRGEHMVIMGPSMAREQGIWAGDPDKRITLKPEFAEEIVAKNKELGKRNRLTMPYVFDNVSQELARWRSMGIESAAEMRAALREYIGLREAPAEASKIKQMERAMIGRKNDGLDFFPTPVETAQAMIDAADIKEGMSVLEPSAGMGHIAEQIRDVSGIDPDVVEFSSDRRELLEAKGFNVVGNDFMDISPRGFTYGDVFKDKDGVEGIMRGSGGLGSNRVGFVPLGKDERQSEWRDRDELVGVRKNVGNSGYDRILMNPPFSNRRDAEHVQHAYSLLKPGGRLVAIMGEGVFFGQDKKAKEFREWLEEVGGTSEKLDEGTFLDPSLPVNTGVNARMVVVNKPESDGNDGDRVRYAEADSDLDGLGFAAEFLNELSFEDAAFRHTISKSNTLQGNIANALPGVEYLGEDTRTDEREESGADRRFVFAMPQRDQRLFYVYERGNEIWFDVSRLQQGDQGSAIYHGVANYAHNTDKVFIGDPMGLSEDAVIRRTSAMLSSALRFGTTRHLGASREQIKGDASKGIEPLNWRGDDLDKTKALIHTFVKNLRNKFPKIGDYRYDFSTLQFTGPDGRPVSRELFHRAGETGVAGEARAGEGSLRRGILIQSLASSESGQRPGILEQVLSRSAQFVSPDGDLDAVFSKAGKGSLTAADKAIYGMAAEGKSAADILKFIASASRNPFNRHLARLLQKTGINPKITVGDGAGWKMNAGEGHKYAAAYNPKTDTTALFSVAASERNVLHELVHAATIRALGRNGLASAQMKALFAHVEKNGRAAGLFYDKLTKRGVYGMSDIDEFIAEAFTNPKFQEKLKSVSAASVGGKVSSAWNWFIRIVRGILGLNQSHDNALSKALEIGLGVMREDMALRKGESSIPFSEITGNEIDKVLGRNIQEKARNWMKINLQGKSFKNDATGWDISVGRRGISKSMMHAAKDVHSRSVAAIPALLKNAVLVASEENRDANERKAIPLVHHFYAPLLVGGNKYIARLVVKEATDGTRFYDFDTSDEISPANSAKSGSLPKEDPASGPSLSKQGGTVPSARLNMSMAELRSYVKADHGGTDPRFVRYNVTDEGWSVSDQAKEAVMRLAGRPMLDPADPFAAENARLREQDQSLWSKAKKQLRRYLAPGGLLPQSVFAEKIKRDSEFQAVEFDVRHLIGGLEHAVKTDFGMAFDKLSKEQMRPITEALAGNVPASLPEATKTAAIAMRQYIDGMSTEYLKIIQEKIDAKMLKALETGKDADKAQAINDIELFEKIKGNIGRYVHRSYQAFDDPKWFEKVPATVLNASRLYLKQGYIESGETDAKAAQLAEVTLHEILKNGTAYDSMESFIAESKLGAKDLSVLMRRKEVPAQIRALLGEYPDARLNFTKSATKMGRLIWNTRFLDRVRDIGMGSFFFEGKDRPPAATTQIAAEGSEVYAPLNGLWTFPEIAQSFKDALGKEQMSDLYRAIVRANGLVKYGKTVLAPTAAMRNWQSAMFFSLANGHFDLTQMKKSIAAFREQVSQNATGGDLKYLRHLKQLGVVYDTPYAGEMARLMEDARMEELLSSDKGDAVRWFRKANQMAQGFYTFGDDFWKIIGFENEKAGLMKAGLSLQDAEVEAAKRIRDTYPTYSMVGRGVQWLSRFPLAGTFVSFPAEIIRTSSNMLRTVAADLKSDNPKLRELGMKRAAGMAFVSAAFWSLAALSKAMAGVGDDEEEAIRDLAPEWQKNSTFLFVGRDEKGNLRYFDMSFLDPYGYWKRPITAMMRDQPWEDSLASGLRGMIEPFLGADIAAKAVFEAVANQKESGGKVYKEKDGAIDQAVDIADHLRKALQPGVVGNVERLVKASTDVRRSSGQPYSVEDEMVALVGWRATTVEPKTALYYRAFDFTDALAEARKTLTDTLRDANDVSPEDIKDAKERAKAKQEQAFSEMQRLVGAAESAGMSKMQIIQTLRLSNISQANIASLMRGATPAVTVTPQLAAKAVQQAKQLRGDEFAAEVSSRYRQAMTN